MPRTKTTRPDARSAPDAAPDAAPAPGTAPVPGSPAAAVHAVLAANPGAATAVIADTAGISRPATRDALAALEAAGAATRVKGGKPGMPDTWTLTEPPATAEATTGQDGEVDQAGDSLAEDVPPAARDEAAEAGPPDGEDPAPEGPAQQDGNDAGASAAPAPGSGAIEDAQPHDDPASGQLGSEAGQPAGDAGQAGDPGDPGTAQEEGDDAPVASGDEAGSAPDPAVVTGLTERLDQVRAAADEAELVLTANGDLKRVLAGLDEIYEQAAEARRALKAAIGGKKGGPATRPGGLRENVLAHLRANPGTEFTPHQLHNVLGNSSGAIANALDTLVKLGDAELACEKPRRFRLAASAPDTAADGPAPDPADDGVSDGAGAGDGTELAGAA